MSSAMPAVASDGLLPSAAAAAGAASLEVAGGVDPTTAQKVVAAGAGLERRASVASLRLRSRCVGDGELMAQSRSGGKGPSAPAWPLLQPHV
mgnify:CR=1 FL=1